uniref:Uncharacterized protein n=1 Tax=Oryza rufipogon TaxID=4529 RepID=A0A0E0QQA2_ORYRU
MGASTNARDRAIAGRSTIRTPEMRSSGDKVAGATGKTTIDAYKSFIYKERESAEQFALHILAG